MSRSSHGMSHHRVFGVALAVAVVAAACSGGGDDETLVIEVPVDADQVSPAPEVVDAATTTYPPLDLGFLGVSASSSGPAPAAPDDLEVGFTEEGYPYRGRADAAITLIEYSDYACPFCGRHAAQTSPVLLERYGSDVRFVFREFPLIDLHPTAPAAHIAALCAGEQGAQQYWDLHDAIYAQQESWTGLADPREFLAELASAIGLDADAFAECAASDRMIERVAAGIEDARAAGFDGTPAFQLTAAGIDDTFSISGAQPIEEFAASLDALLAGERPPGATAGDANAELQLPYWLEPDAGRRPDPALPGRTLAGDFYKGDPDAPVVVVEVSDFECPYCRTHALEAQPAIDEELVESGEVMWIYKQLPLPIHPHAQLAASASVCAGDQGAFWEMHDALFEQVERWTVDDTEAQLVAMAGELGLDETAFAECLAGRDALERVLTDQVDVGEFADSTPTFLVLHDGQGFKVAGAQDPDQFIELLRSRVGASTGGSDS